MSTDHRLKTLQAMCTHNAQNNGPTRLQTSMGVGDLRQLVGARYDVESDVVRYPHQWHNGKEWRTTGFELVPK